MRGLIGLILVLWLSVSALAQGGGGDPPATCQCMVDDVKTCKDLHGNLPVEFIFPPHSQYFGEVPYPSCDGPCQFVGSGSYQDVDNDAVWQCQMQPPWGYRIPWNMTLGRWSGNFELGYDPPKIEVVLKKPAPPNYNGPSWSLDVNVSITDKCLEIVSCDNRVGFCNKVWNSHLYLYERKCKQRSRWNEHIGWSTANCLNWVCSPPVE